MSFLEEVKSVLSVVSGNEVSQENASKFTEKIDEIGELLNSVQVEFEDGLQLSDFEVIGELVAPLMKIASEFSEYSGADKKKFVQEVVWTIYRTIDQGESGNENRINIPWVVGSLERGLEKWIIDFAAGLAVESLFKRMRESEEV